MKKDWWNYLPKDISTFKTDGKKTIIDILKESGLCKTRNEARRLIEQGAVECVRLVS